jgi:hypothetical protein
MMILRRDLIPVILFLLVTEGCIQCDRRRDGRITLFARFLVPVTISRAEWMTLDVTIRDDDSPTECHAQVLEIATGLASTDPE